MRATDVKPSWLPTGGHELVTSDAHPGLADAIASVLPGASGHGVAGRSLGGYANVGQSVTTGLPLAPDCRSRIIIYFGPLLVWHRMMSGAS